MGVCLCCKCQRSGTIDFNSELLKSEGSVDIYKSVTSKRGKIDGEEQKESPSRDFSPNLKQDLSGLSGFFRQLRQNLAS